MSVVLPVECDIGMDRLQARSANLSVTGVSLEILVDPPPDGSKVRVLFDLPEDGGRVEAVGTVIWSRPDGPQPRLGLRFDRFLQGYVELGDYVVVHRGTGD